MSLSFPSFRDAPSTISEYWDDIATEQVGQDRRDSFNASLERIYSDLHNVYRRAKSRTHYLDMCSSMCC